MGHRNNYAAQYQQLRSASDTIILGGVAADCVQLAAIIARRLEAADGPRYRLSLCPGSWREGRCPDC